MDMDRISGETNHVSENSAKGYSGRELKALLGCTLFSGIDAGELTGLLGCLDARKRTFLKNEFIYHSGEPVSSMGIVLSGSVHIVKEDFWAGGICCRKPGKGTFSPRLMPAFRELPYQSASWQLRTPPCCLSMSAGFLTFAPLPAPSTRR